MSDQKLSKKVKRAKPAMAVTKAGRKSNAVHIKPKAVVVQVLYADKADMHKYMPTRPEDEKALPLSVCKELEDLFLKGR